ncbi:hypothetical protein FRB97_000295 [Tulasnella sp. 331]|nr:hypothetical protein FRB97_000295 [Tulasnella sp. 331]KAG8888910.1 hypothetical protein FRB98_006452 [Tulasnella sp. 332]
MLNLFLCTSRSAIEEDDGDYTWNTSSNSPPRKKNSMGKGKKAVIKGLQIGAPTDFKHENHMGYDEIANMDVARYQEEMRIRIAQMTQAGTVISASFPQVSQATPREPANALINPSERRSSPPSSISSIRSSSARPVRRKAVPSVLLDNYSYREVATPQPSPPLMRERRGSENSVQRAQVPSFGEKQSNASGPSSRKPVAPYEVPIAAAHGTKAPGPSPRTRQPNTIPYETTDHPTGLLALTGIDRGHVRTVGFAKLVWTFEDMSRVMNSLPGLVEFQMQARSNHDGQRDLTRVERSIRRTQLPAVVLWLIAGGWPNLKVLSLSRSQRVLALLGELEKWLL